MIVALFTRAWIEMPNIRNGERITDVALFTRAWIEITSWKAINAKCESPSSRGRGLKSLTDWQ